MKPHRAPDGERTLAVFIDFENLGLGFGNRRDKFSIERVLERLVEKGKIVAKKAYADWSRFGNYAASLHASAVELVEIPKRSQTGKNSADIRMCVDAMDLAYSKDHIDTFVVVSGDSDFSPLVSKLKELGKHVIGLGLADATSNLLRDNCDEFIYYEDLDRKPAPLPAVSAEIPELKQKAFTLVLDTLHALRRENKELILPSMIKDTIKRKKPSFNEEYHGYRTFTDLLEDAQRYGLIELDRHKTSGSYMVTRFGGEPKPPVAAAPAAPVPAARAPAPVPKVAEPAPPRQAQPRQPQQRRSGRAEPAVPKAPPAKPPLAPIPPADEPEPESRVPLGRALIDEIDGIDDADEVPSYRPRKAAGAAPAKPAAKPAGRTPAAKAAKPEPKPAAKPARAEKPAAPARQPRAATPPARQTPPAAPPKPTPAAVPADESDDFGAGLL